jgi:alkylation response protein AidB-like acyl-CoA dehydrogenase
MDFRDDADAAAFRSEFRAWLAAHAPAEPEPLGGGARARFWSVWHRALYDGGWMGLSWPVEVGGRGLSPLYEAIFNDEIGAAGAPPAPHVGFLGRALLHFGSDEQRRALLPGLLSGEQVWCQGFSEPGAGSDLAAIATRAVPDEAGDGGWRVNGQKIWTSDAAWADRCLLLARTDSDAPRHRGISALVVDMHQPGIEVRPIVEINGDREFNEVFFDDAFVPADGIVGAPGQGWEIAMTTVGYERGPTDVGFSSRYARTIRDLEHEARGRELRASEAAALARAYVQVEVLRIHVLRSLTRRLDGGAPGADGSIDKLLSSSTEQLLGHASLDADPGTLTGDAPGALSEYLYSRAATIAGGSAQIQRTILAERLLGLPRG